MQVDGPAAVSPTNLEDASHLAGGHARGMAFPASEADVVALMRRHEPLLPIGAQSCVTGGATPMGELLVSSARLQTIVEYGDGYVRAQAGVPLDVLVAALDARGDAYPPVPTWTAATVGGIVSTNAAGPATFKYGVTRDWVLGLTIVLPCGDVLELRRGAACVDEHGTLRLATTAGDVDVTIPSLPMPDVPKRSAGYHCAAGMDAIDLFVGAEGTLGFVVDATLRTVRRRGNTARAVVPVTVRGRRARLRAGPPRRLARDLAARRSARHRHLGDSSTSTGARWNCSARTAWTVASASPARPIPA